MIEAKANQFEKETDLAFKNFKSKFKEIAKKMREDILSEANQKFDDDPHIEKQFGIRDLDFIN